MTVPIVTMDVRVGGRYRFEMHGDESIHVLSGEYREVTPPEKLVFTWMWEQGDMAGMEMLVTITHAKLPGDAAEKAHGQGWQSTLDCLADRLAGKPKMP